MKTKYFCFITILSVFFSFSCSDNSDDSGGDPNNEYNDVNKWIENTMRDYYYWYKEIPEKTDLSLEPKNFFVSLLSQKDGKIRNSSHHYYSTIEQKSNTLRSTTADGELSLGFEYHRYSINNGKKHALKVIYILPNSPASKSELKRGDWIFTVNGENISDNIVENLNNGSKTLGVATKPSGNITKQVVLAPAIVEDNPVYLIKIYHFEGKKIGYLIYNHFTPGKTDNDETYNNSLRKAFSEFKNESLDEFILDLRYNRGGLVTCAQLLATMLAPSEALGDIFCNVVYNDKKSSKNYTYKFDTNYMQQKGYGANLNLKRLFIITSESTASASEAVINSLLPFMENNLIITGERTEGKNVGSITLTDSRYNWELHPIVCLISNKNNDSDYENGFIPTTDYNLSDLHENLNNLGDENEYMLNKILRNILYNERVSIGNLKSASADTGLTLVSSSLDRKNTNGVLLK